MISNYELQEATVVLLKRREARARKGEENDILYAEIDEVSVAEGEWKGK